MENIEVIEKGIPMESATRRPPIIPLLSAMEIGDSFLTRRPHSQIYGNAKLAGIRVRIREEENGYRRVWRIEKWSKARPLSRS